MEFLQPWIPHLAALGGIAFGALVTWFMCRNRAQAMHARFEERSKAAQKAVVDLEAGCANLEAEVRQLRHSEAVSLKRQSELEMLAQTQLRGLEEKQQLLKDAEQRLAQAFRAISTESLKATQHEFLQMARSAFHSQQQQATSELEQRRVAVETLVKPVAATLNKVESRIGDLERARRESESALGEQVRLMAHAQAGLQRETAQLIQALRQPAGRGRWGEVQLQRVVELAGMQAYCDFQPRKAAEDSSGPHPDLIVQLPTGRQIAVDSHAPLEAYLAAGEAESAEKQNEERKRFAATIGEHLSQLSSSAYRKRCGSDPEFVVLFLPGESFLSAALTEDPGLLERGIEQGVLLATPASLVALLRAAAVGWRQEGIAQKARMVSETGRELYDYVATLTAQIAKVGESLDAAVQNYNTALGSLEGRVLPGARKLGDLGIAAPSQALPAVGELERKVRHPHNLSRLPLSSDMNSMAATGEMPDAGFEGFGFAEPAPTATAQKSPPEAKTKPKVKVRVSPKRQPEKPETGSNAAAEELRNALDQPPKKRAS